MSEQLIQTMRAITSSPTTSWVLFENGTFVFFKTPAPTDLKTTAIDLMKEYGWVAVGGAHGDFGWIPIKPKGASDVAAWLITCHHPDIATMILKDAFSDEIPDETTIGLIGRELRDKDAKTLNIVHIEDKRS